MPPPPLALSIHGLIDKVGADAGFASIIALAVLVLIYFVQARETATLREQGEEASERIHQLEERLVQLGRTARQAVATSAPPASQAAGRSASPARANPARAAALVGAPAGTAAPALAAATRLIAPPVRSPAPATAAASARVLAPSAAPAPPVAPSPPVAPVPAVGPAPAPAVGPAPAPAVGPAPVPAATAVAEAPLPSPATVAGANAGNGGRSARSPVPPEVQLRPRRGGDPARGTLAPGRPLLYEPPWWRRLLLPLVLLVALAGVAAVLLALTSSGTGTSSPARAGIRPRAGGHRAGAVAARDVTVAVLNGTAINHLAFDTAHKLGAIGYRIASTGNAPSQTHASTEVEYLAGSDRAAALSVARALGLSASHVVPVVGADEAVACHSAGACPAGVILVVGQDLQRLASTSTTTAPAATTPAGGASTTSTSTTSTSAGAPTTTSG